jgi:hypothetical protein
LYANVISTVGVVISAVGFLFTVSQIRRTASAAEATRDAIKDSASRMQLNYLMVMLPELKIYEQELDAAAEGNDKRSARRVLVAYSHAANRVAALLSQSNVEAEAVFAAQLRTSAEAATAAKSSLYASEQVTVSSATGTLAALMSDVVREAEGLLATYQLKVG